VTRPFAIVPACGHSTRMGQPKLAMPLGGSTVIERIVSTLRAGGVERVLVVVGPHVSEVERFAESAGAQVLSLKEATPDMRTTVERGLDRLEERYRPALDECWFLAPADHPAFGANVVSELLAATTGPHSIIVPTHAGRRGHPALLRWRHAAGIRALPADVGINSYLRSHADETLELPVADPGILANLDTPEDYERIRANHF
jgi:molybdenum cofactor cytidylyltransferase